MASRGYYQLLLRTSQSYSCCSRDCGQNTPQDRSSGARQAYPGLWTIFPLCPPSHSLFVASSPTTGVKLPGVFHPFEHGWPSRWRGVFQQNSAHRTANRFLFEGRYIPDMHDVYIAYVARWQPCNTEHDLLQGMFPGLDRVLYEHLVTASKDSTGDNLDHDLFLCCIVRTCRRSSAHAPPTAPLLLALSCPPPPLQPSYSNISINSLKLSYVASPPPKRFSEG